MFMSGLNCLIITVKSKRQKKNKNKKKHPHPTMASFQWKIDWHCYATSCTGTRRSKMTHQDKYYGLSHSEAYVNWKKKICHGKLGHCLDKTLL